jgi:hypothetical protein
LSQVPDLGSSQLPQPSNRGDLEQQVADVINCLIGLRDYALAHNEQITNSLLNMMRSELAGIENNPNMPAKIKARAAFSFNLLHNSLVWNGSGYKVNMSVLSQIYNLLWETKQELKLQK